MLSGRNSTHNWLTNKKYSPAALEINQQRSQLPVWNYYEEFKECLKSNKFIVVSGATGSGKTTQIAQWCTYLCNKDLQHKIKKVVCTQPRRIATIEVAKRVALEMAVKVSALLKRLVLGFNSR